MHYCLLLTACIKPEQVTINPIIRIDPAIRMQDYFSALKFWLGYEQTYFDSIVFVENSSSDLFLLRNLVAKENKFNLKVEFLQFQSSPVPDGVHYGYSELEMIDFAFDHSKLIANTTHIIKVTGRLYFPQLIRLLKWIPKGIEFASDSRDYTIASRDEHYIVTTLFIVEKRFYASLLYDAKSTMNTIFEYSLEETLYFQILKPLYIKGIHHIILRLPFTLSPVGFGAHWNVNYNSFKKQTATLLRDFARIIIPAFWI